MYELTKKALEIINADKSLQMNIAILMGNGYMAVHQDLIRKGKAIAKNYDAVTYLMKHLKLPLNDIRKKIKK